MSSLNSQNLIELLSVDILERLDGKGYALLREDRDGSHSKKYRSCSFIKGGTSWAHLKVMDEGNDVFSVEIGTYPKGNRWAKCEITEVLSLEVNVPVMYEDPEEYEDAVIQLTRAIILNEETSDEAYHFMKGKK